MKTQEYKIDLTVKELITASQAFHYRIVPKSYNNSVLVLATDTPITPSLINELAIVLDKEIKMESLESSLLDIYLGYNYRKVVVQDFLKGTDDYLTCLITTAKQFGSSDIHIEVFETKARVRFRLDGKLKEQFQIRKEDYPQLINQIKIKAGMDIAQNRLAQDGRIRFSSNAAQNSAFTSERLDIRVSCIPTLHGEKMVLRLLHNTLQNIALKDLGFTPSEFQRFKQAISHSQGLVLISGPTGSGKTTTLYATLKELNKEVSNIITIEDPIEYTLEGINQVQLREDIGFDFPSALRSFLRQDPDIIMVGEIRDEATADMAVKAALTGHLVLSTIHTNSSWETVSRLVDMGIPSFLLANTLKMSVAQRLVRKLCPSCKTEVSVSDSPLALEGILPKDIQKVYAPVGCPSCFYTGYKGRQPIYEVLPITKALEPHIRANNLEINTYFDQKNIVSLPSNALRLLKSGVTSLEEVYPFLMNNL